MPQSKAQVGAQRFEAAMAQLTEQQHTEQEVAMTIPSRKFYGPERLAKVSQMRNSFVEFIQHVHPAINPDMSRE